MLNSSTRGWVLGLVAAACLLQGCATRGSLSSGPPTGAQIAAAKTKAEHEALAVDYDKLAAEARSKVAEHQQMGGSYKTYAAARPGNLKAHGGTTLSEHCDSLVHLYSDIAKDYEALAKEHREMAAGAQ